jgi:hypothetical protein
VGRCTSCIYNERVARATKQPAFSFPDLVVIGNRDELLIRCRPALPGWCLLGLPVACGIAAQVLVNFLRLKDIVGVAVFILGFMALCLAVMLITTIWGQYHFDTRLRRASRGRWGRMLLESEIRHIEAVPSVRRKGRFDVSLFDGESYALLGARLSEERAKCLASMLTVAMGL